MTSLWNVVLLLGMASGPDDPALRDEALADLNRRTGAAVEGTDRRERRQQEDPRPQRPQEPLEERRADAPSIIDWDWLELHPRVGVSMFSKDYHINMSPTVVIEGRAPLVLLSPSDNPDGEYFGVFAELNMTFIKRTIKPSVDKPSGAMVALGVGMDYTILRNATWMILVRAGIQYTTFGGVTDLKDGMSPFAGFTVGLSVARSVSITLSPEYILGQQSDTIIVGVLGVAIDF
jgi:hypothetical protein